jgi:hypothetical protein
LKDCMARATVRSIAAAAIGIAAGPARAPVVAVAPNATARSVTSARAADLMSGLKI